MEQPFYAIECELTDGSYIWEVWQSGSSQRLASAASESEAWHLVNKLNSVVAAWSDKTVENTVDC